MSFVRSLIFVVYFYSGMVVLGLSFLPTLLMPKSAALLGIRLWARMAVFGMKYILGAETEIRGRENLPSEPIILCSKHQSMVDTLLPFLLLKSPCFILKKELMYYPIFGWFAWKTGMIAIDRKGSTRALKEMTTKAKAAVADGRSLVIFPEGTRVHPDEEADIKPGIAFLYREVDAPLVPVALNTGFCWPAKGIQRFSGRMIFHVLPAVEDGMSRKVLVKTLKTLLDTETFALNTEFRDQQ